MFIVTITDALGMTYVEAFSTVKRARAFVPPAWAKLKTPTKSSMVRCIDNYAVEPLHV